MKFRLAMLGLAMTVGAWAEPLLKPAKSVAFAIRRDPRKWEVRFEGHRENGLVIEMSPRGDSRKVANETVRQEFTLGAADLVGAVGTWKIALLRADQSAQIHEIQMADGSVMVTFIAPENGTEGIRRFLKSPDGIYMGAVVWRYFED